MHRKKLKEKNIVGVIKDNMQDGFSLTLSPTLSYGSFIIGENILSYKDVVIKDHTQGGEEGWYWDGYVATNSDYSIDIWCNKTNIIHTIRLVEHCYYQGRDIIGMNIFEALALLNIEPGDINNDWRMSPRFGKKNREHHHAYYLYLPRTTLEIELWTWLKKVRAVLISDCSLDTL